MYEEIIQAIIPEIGEIVKNEIRINCIYSDCPNPHKHLYFNLEKGVGFCHRCNRPSSIKNLVCHYKGVSFLEAEQIITGTGEKKAKSLLFRLKKLESNYSLNIQEQEDVLISLPAGFISFASGEWDFPYLEQRKISYETAIEYGMGFCDYGRWSNRLIVPIYLFNELRGFVARSIYDPPGHLSKPGKKVWSRLKRYIKVLNPKGFNSSRLLFNYDNIDEEMIITEGIFDALRCGKSGVAMFGKHMSKFQEELIRRKRPGRIYVMLDADAYDDAEEIANRLAASGLNVFLPKYKNGDPGSMERSEISYYLAKAKKISPLRLCSLKTRLHDVYK